MNNQQIILAASALYAQGVPTKQIEEHLVSQFGISVLEAQCYARGAGFGTDEEG